jgi:Flp pilus assembly protein TadB
MTPVLAALAAATATLLALPPVVRPSKAGRQRRSPTLPLPVVAGASAALLTLMLVPLPLGLTAAVPAAWAATRMVAGLEPASVRRQRSRLEAAVPEVVDLMAAALNAGLSPAGALREVMQVVHGPARTALAPYVARLGLGADPQDVWLALARDPSLGALGRALARATESGASVAGALGRLAVDQRERRRAADEARARTVEVRAALPLGLCLLPAFVLLGVVPLVAGAFDLTVLAR